jgi:hypothetical protein
MAALVVRQVVFLFNVNFMYGFFKPAVVYDKLIDLQFSEIEQSLIEVTDGKRGWVEIISELLLLKFSSNEIDRVIKSFVLKGYFAESDNSELTDFESKELEELDKQLTFFNVYYGESRSPFSKYTAKGLNAQLNLKKSKILLLYSDFEASILLNNLNDIGLKNVDVIEIQEVGSLIELEYEIDIEQFNQLFSVDICAYDTVVYASSKFDIQMCRLINQICNSLSVDFLPFNRKGTIVEIGPFFLINQSACFDCFNKRRYGANPELNKNFDYVNYKINIAIGIEALAFELFKKHSKIMLPSSKNNVISIDYLSMNFELLPVLKLPRCKCCGRVNTRPTNKVWEAF